LISEYLKKQNFNVDLYDIGMEENEKKFDCIILSHVLEHIYDLNNFVINLDKNLNNNGLIYIEVPNAEFYDKFDPLQEINIEHINFFSKLALSNKSIKY